MRLNRRVSIWKHVRVADGKWRYCRPVLDAKGKMVADMVTVTYPRCGQLALTLLAGEVFA